MRRVNTRAIEGNWNELLSHKSEFFILRWKNINFTSFFTLKTMHMEFLGGSFYFFLPSNLYRRLNKINILKTKHSSVLGDCDVIYLFCLYLTWFITSCNISGLLVFNFDLLRRKLKDILPTFVNFHNFNSNGYFL